jgi:hypothetical protein
MTKFTRFASPIARDLTPLQNVRRQLGPNLIGRRRVVIFAGQRYREFLVPALLSEGYEVDVPMANLGIGERYCLFCFLLLLLHVFTDRRYLSVRCKLPVQAGRHRNPRQRAP